MESENETAILLYHSKVPSDTSHATTCAYYQENIHQVGRSFRSILHDVLTRWSSYDGVDDADQQGPAIFSKNHVILGAARSAERNILYITYFLTWREV